MSFCFLFSDLTLADLVKWILIKFDNGDVKFFKLLDLFEIIYLEKLIMNWSIST